MKLLCYGDSISADTYTITAPMPSGYYKRLVAGQIGATIVGDPGAALSGSLLPAPASDYATRIAPFVPDVLIVTYGTNNFYHMGPGYDLASWQGAWEAFIAAWQAAQPRPSLWSLGLLPTLHGSGWTDSYNDEWLRAEMDRVTRNATLAAGGRYVSLAGFPPGSVRADGHPDVTGHGYIAGAILAAMGV